MFLVFSLIIFITNKCYHLLLTNRHSHLLVMHLEQNRNICSIAGYKSIYYLDEEKDTITQSLHVNNSQRYVHQSDSYSTRIEQVVGLVCIPYTYYRIYCWNDATQNEREQDRLRLFELVGRILFVREIKTKE